MKTKFMILLAALGLAGASVRAQIFSEDFGTLADGTGLTSSNTNFDYLRTGAGGGSYVAENPSTIGTGSSMILTGSTSTSLTGVGLSTGLGGTNLLTMGFSLKIADVSVGDLFVGAGTGTMFTGNGTFSTNDLLFGIQSDGGNLEFRTGSWNNVSFTLQDNTQYDFWIQVNNSGATVDGIANDTMDLYINNTLVGDGLSIAGNQSANGFRIYGVSGATSSEIDDIEIYNTITAIPEPSSIILMGLVGLAAVMILRKRKN